jgi:hypothetical protein
MVEVDKASLGLFRSKEGSQSRPWRCSLRPDKAPVSPTEDSPILAVALEPPGNRTAAHDRQVILNRHHDVMGHHAKKAVHDVGNRPRTDYEFFVVQTR